MSLLEHYASMTDEERENERYTLTAERELIGMSAEEAIERLFWLDGACKKAAQMREDACEWYGRSSYEAGC